MREGQSTEVERCLRGFGSAPASSPVQWHTLPPQSADTAAELALSARAAVSHAGWLQGLRETPSEATAYLAWVAHMLDGLGAFRVLCALREGPHGVAGLNLAIERLAQRKGWLRGGGQAYEGRPIMVTRNDAALKLFNGDIGILLRGPPSAQGGRELRAWFAHDGAANAERVRSVALTRLPAVETAFAMTVHKSQGSEFSHAMVVLPGGDSPLLTRELLYTGMTRARERLTLCGSEPQALLRALQRRTQRMSGLASLLSTQPLSTPVST